MKNTAVTKDLANKQLLITRDFDGTVEHVWRAWTEADLLDKWWAPRPYRAETKSMDFKEGGVWLYSMVSPQDERHWCRVGFKTIAPQRNFTAVTNFCDENGTPTPDFPNMYWKVGFSGSGAASKVEVELSFDNEADLEAILQMGFEQGFTAALTNLDELLEE